MDWAHWRPLYEQILQEFGYDRTTDEKARDFLDEQLARHAPVDLEALRAQISGRDAWIVGAAVTPEQVEAIPHDAPLIVSDAAAGVVVPRAFPTAIVTDLDGEVPLQAAANAVDIPVFLHAHGDNLDALERHLPAFRGPVVGTTQAEPKGRVLNFGGFTDGDRAGCIAAELGAARLVLVGFDFDNPRAKPGRDPEVKRRKLAWARRILYDELDVPVVSADTQS